MKTSIAHLPQSKQDELNRFVDLIKEEFAGRIEMIILYGSFARGTWVDDSYVEDGITYEYKSDYDLLIVTRYEGRSRSKKFVGKVRDYVRAHYETETPVSLIFHGYDYITEMLDERRYFFCDIYHEGIVLYNEPNWEFEEPKEISYVVRVEKVNEYLEEWGGSATRFLRNYYLNMGESEFDKEYYKLASLMLHQATERFLMTNILIFTDYKPKTHDLEMLLGQAIKEDSRFRHPFPRKTQLEKDMFDKLQESYIGSRYKKDFVITKEQLEYLVVRVEQLKKLTYDICNEKLEQFRELAEKEK